MLTTSNVSLAVGKNVSVEVEGRWGGWNNSRSSVERRSQWEERLGRRLGVVEDGLHAVVSHCHQVRLLVRHCLEYGGAPEIHRNFDRFKGGDGGEEDQSSAKEEAATEDPPGNCRGCSF